MDVSWIGPSVYVDGHPVAEMDYQILEAFRYRERIIVLLDPDSAPGNVGVFQNLAGVDLAAGEVAWVASLPSSYSGDCYVSINLDRDHLIAVSWSGWKVGIDPSTGFIVEREFLK